MLSTLLLLFSLNSAPEQALHAPAPYWSAVAATTGLLTIRETARPRVRSVTAQRSGQVCAPCPAMPLDFELCLVHAQCGSISNLTRSLPPPINN